jgi:hypothetical protein
MRFSVEQIFLTDADGKPITDRATAFHVVEADALDAALSAFLLTQEAEVIGPIQRFHGAQAVATAHQGSKVFTVHLMPGSDAFRANPPRLSPDGTRVTAQPADDKRPDQRQR